MTIHKMTTVSGHRAGYTEPTAPVLTTERYEQVDANRPFVYVNTLRGHWAPEKARDFARRAGVVGPVEVVHSTGDLSGKGRGGYDRAWIVTDDAATPRSLTDFERSYDDADDVNDLYDEAEGA